VTCFVAPDGLGGDGGGEPIVTQFGDCAVWRWDDGLAGNCVWGEIRVEHAPTFFRSLDALLAGARGPFDYLADNRRMRVGDHDIESFGHVFEGLLARNPTMAGRLRRVASVPPDNAIGAAIVGATSELARRSFELAVFRDTASALAWLGRPDAGAIGPWLDALPHAARALVTTAPRVPAEPARDPAIAPDASARRLGTSTRSLQRALALEGTTLGAEQQRARIARARTMLELEDTKIESVARAVGFRSTSHFIRVYREHTGTTPGRAREERRG